MTGKTALPLQRWRIGLAGHGPAAPAQPVRPKPWCHPTITHGRIVVLFEPDGCGPDGFRRRAAATRKPYHEARSELATTLQVLGDRLNRARCRRKPYAL
jgi:hypothetical protein